MDTEAVLEDAQLRVSGEGVSYQMTIEPSRRPWLPLLDAAARAPELPPGMGSARMTPQLQWLTWRPITDVVRISAQSHVQFSYGPLQPTRALRRYTQLPEGSNPRTLALARQMRADQIGRSTRLNSSHLVISYAVFCLKKKKKTHAHLRPRQQYS